jgi:hypothetical protein
MLVYGASTEPPPGFVEVAEVAIVRIDGSGRSLEQRTAAVEALLASHGLLEIVERRLAALLRARARRAAEPPVVAPHAGRPHESWRASAAR